MAIVPTVKAVILMSIHYSNQFRLIANVILAERSDPKTTSQPGNPFKGKDSE